jgi:calpain-15
MKRDPKHAQKWETYMWRRPSEVWGAGNFKVFNKIDPTDIKQGDCGDCYFLSALSSVAEYPERIESLFLTKDVNDAGCYAMRFFVNGERHEVVVDDYFPWSTIKDNWAFSRSGTDKEIWVLLLEKAWAKIFGSY